MGVFICVIMHSIAYCRSRKVDYLVHYLNILNFVIRIGFPRHTSPIKYITPSSNTSYPPMHIASPKKHIAPPQIHVDPAHTPPSQNIMNLEDKITQYKPENCQLKHKMSVVNIESVEQVNPAVDQYIYRLHLPSVYKMEHYIPDYLMPHAKYTRTS